MSGIKRKSGVYKRTIKHRRKISKSQMGHKGYMLGKHHSEEAKKKMSESQFGHTGYMLGKKHSDGTKRKMSETHKRIGTGKWMKGRHLSEETREKMSGVHNWHWKGGISDNPYPKEFNPVLKLKIRTRDNFTCCLCGRTEREELEELNRVLCINHINFNKNNCREENLNTLCVRCNSKINRERDYWIDYFNMNYSTKEILKLIK